MESLNLSEPQVAMESKPPSDDDDAILVCMRVADSTIHVPDSTRGKCKLCGEAVLVSALSPPVTQFLCVRCAKDTVLDDAKLRPPTQKQLEAVAQYFKKHAN